MKEYVEWWDDPVSDGCRYWEDLESAIEYIADNSWNANTRRYEVEKTPEELQCCIGVYPEFDADYVVEFIDDNDHCPDSPFYDYVTKKDLEELQKFINKWIENIGWRKYDPIDKFVKIRTHVEEWIENA